MNKKNFNRNDTKIKEQRNIFIPLCVVLTASIITGSIAYGINVKQTKELRKLEAISQTEEDRAKEYRAEVKKYFANYINSDKAKNDIISQLNIDEKMYQQLEEMGLINTDLISEDDMDEIVGLAITRLSNSIDLSGTVDAQESTLYQTIYNDVLYKVRSNLTNNNALTVYQTIDYDIDDITEKATKKIQETQQRLNNKKENIDVEAVRDAYIATLVDEAVRNLQITTNEESQFKKEILNQMTAYFNSDEGKELIQDGVNGKNGIDGKDGVDGQTLDFTDTTVRAMLTSTYETILQYVKENPKSVKINAIEGKGISIDETTDTISVIDSKEGNTLKLRLIWQRGDWDDVQNDKTLKIDVPSFGSIKYTQNENKTVSINLDDIQTLDNSISNAYFVVSQEGENGSSKNIAIPDLADVYAKTYAHYLYEDLRTRCIGSAEYDETTGKYYCTVLIDPNDTNSKCRQELQDNDGVISCPIHHSEVITLDSLFEQLNNTVNAATETVLKTNYDFVYTEKKAISESELLSQADDVDKSIEIIEKYILDNYREVLRAMDNGHSNNGVYIGNSIFNAYDLAFKNLNDMDQSAPNHYGTSSVITLADATNPDTEELSKEAVIVQKLITDGYIERTKAGNLEFMGDTTSEKLENAINSQIVNISKRYNNYTVHDTSNANTSLIAQIEKWQNELQNSMHLIDLLYGKGILFEINDSSALTFTYALPSETKNILDQFITADTQIPVNYTIVKDNLDTTNAKENYVNDLKNNTIKRVYYQDGIIYVERLAGSNGIKLSCSLSTIKK